MYYTIDLHVLENIFKLMHYSCDTFIAVWNDAWGTFISYEFQFFFSLLFIRNRE